MGYRNVFIMAVTTVISGFQLVACGRGYCAASCQSSTEVQLSPPVGQPGNYRFVVGPHECAVQLPAIRSDCARIENFSVVGFHYNNSPAVHDLNVSVTKDGVEAVNVRAALTDSHVWNMCGETCQRLTFQVAIPEALAPSPRAPCELVAMSGTYAITESRGYGGGCQTLFSRATVVLADGLLQMNDGSCQSQMTEWSPTTCQIRSSTTCSTSSVTNTWELTLTDVRGDGSKLDGSGSVSLSSFTSCTGSAGLVLTRQ